MLTGDLPAPVKNFNPGIKTAYKAIEGAAARKLLQMIPEVLQRDYRGLFVAHDADREHRELVKAADKLCAYVKCLEEIGAGNPEFAQAEKALRASLDTFVPSFRLTLDELE